MAMHERSKVAWLVVPSLLVAAAAFAQPPSFDALKRDISARYPDVPWVAPATLARWLVRPEEERPHLLDVRKPEEFAVSHLRGAVRVDPERPDLDRIPRDHRPIVVYCSVGWRSGNLGALLRERGHERVYNLTGGIFAWANEGRPVWAHGRRAQKVHPYDDEWGQLLREGLRSSR